MPSSIRTRAVVIGAGPAGLLAATVLADHFDQVAILERDAAPWESTARRGVPQGHHTHLLWRSGQQALEELLPGIGRSLAAAGAIQVRIPEGMTWLGPTGRIAPSPSAHYQFLSCSRPLIDSLIYEYVERKPGILLYPSTTATGLVMSHGAVAGVRTRACGGGAGRVVAADAVIDASGRRSAVPRWLTQEGYDLPRKDRADLAVRYFSQTFSKGIGSSSPPALIIAAQPGSARFAAVFPIEGDRWRVTAGDIARFTQPQSDIDLQRLVQSAQTPEDAALYAGAEPVSQIHAFYTARAHRYNYEQPGQGPSGLLVTGDALCTVNPLMGQGMSIAALQALALRRALNTYGCCNLTRRGQNAISKVADAPWRLTAALAISSRPARPNPLEQTRFRLEQDYFRHLENTAPFDRGAADALVGAYSLTTSGPSLRELFVWRGLGYPPLSRPNDHTAVPHPRKEEPHTAKRGTSASS